MNRSRGNEGRPFEEEYFAKRNQELIEKIRLEYERELTREGIARVTGIRDMPVLERLAGAGIIAETVDALALLPLFQVAWADRSVSIEERAAILSAVLEEGIEPNSKSYATITKWLEQSPTEDLFDVWRSYVKGLKQIVDDDAFDDFRTKLLSRAQLVAETSGGLFNLAWTVSDAEQSVLKTIGDELN